MAQDLRQGILATAQALGIDPVDLATAISYETAGTFDPTKQGPTTKWGQHRGLIQFGEPQAQKYGVDWGNPIGSQLGENGAVAKYLKDTGVRPGMGLLDIYSAINAGGVGRYGASDAAAGGAPGTVRDKVEKQMADHRAKAMALLGGASAADGPKGQEMYQRPAASVPGAMIAQSSPSGSPSASPPPAAAQAVASGKSPMADIFGMMALAPQQQPQFSPVQIMGPSGDQANALSSLVAALKGRMA
jgi:hypothetical protein